MHTNASERERLLADLQEVRRAIARDLFVEALPTIGGREISVSQMAALMLLGDGEPRSLSAIAGALGRSTSATSRLIDALVRGKVVHRREDPDDRRARKIEISEPGRRLIGRFLERRADAQLALMEALSDDERARVLDGMALLAAAARRRDGR